jgi:hypothetical protein
VSLLLLLLLLLLKLLQLLLIYLLPLEISTAVVVGVVHSEELMVE